MAVTSPHKTVHFDSGFSGKLGYGLKVRSRLVGTSRFGVATSTSGRDYRLGYGLKVFEDGGMNFDLGFDAQQRKSPAHRELVTDTRIRWRQWSARTAMQPAALAANPLRLRSGSHSGLEACGSHNFPQSRWRVDQDR